MESVRRRRRPGSPALDAAQSSPRAAAAFVCGMPIGMSGAGDGGDRRPTSPTHASSPASPPDLRRRNVARSAAARTRPSASVCPSENAGGGAANDEKPGARQRMQDLLQRVYPPRAHSRNRWMVPLSASVVHALHAATVYIGPATLLSPMRKDLGLSVAQISLPLNAFRAINAALLAPVGMYLDRNGAQRPLRLAIVAAATLSFALPLCGGLWQLTALQSLFAITKLFGGITPLLMLTTTWFSGGAGMATASSLLLSGYSGAGFLAPVMLGSLTKRFGWRVAMTSLCVMFSVVALPLMFLYCRENTEQPAANNNAVGGAPRRGAAATASNNGKLSHGDAREASAAASAVQGKPLPPLFSAEYTALTMVVACFSCSMHIVLDHLLVYINEDVGMSLESAAWFMSLLNAVALGTKLVAGPLGDHFGKGVLMSIFGLVATLAFALMFSAAPALGALTVNPLRIGAFCVIYGIGYAGMFNMATAAVADFGKERLGLRSNVNLMVLFASGSLSSYLAGFLRTKTGSYRGSFLLSAVANALVVGCGLLYSLLQGRRQRILQKQARAAMVPAVASSGAGASAVIHPTSQPPSTNLRRR